MIYGVIALTAVIAGFIGVGIGWVLGARSKALKIMAGFLAEEQKKEKEVE